MSDSRTVVVEFCLSRSQQTRLALGVAGDTLVPEIVAEALYAAKRHWSDPGRAAPIVIRKLAKFYDTELVVGGRRDSDHPAIVLDFVSRHVTDTAEGRGCSFGKWLRKHDVP